MLTTGPMASAQPNATRPEAAASAGGSLMSADPSATSSPFAGGAAFGPSLAASRRPSLVNHATTGVSPAAAIVAQRPSPTFHAAEVGHPAPSSARVRITAPSIHSATAPEPIAASAR